MKETKAEAAKTITEIFDEGTAIDQAIGDAVEEALLEHKRAGNPVCEWRDGKVVWVPPEEINVGNGREGSGGPAS